MYHNLFFIAGVNMAMKSANVYKKKVLGLFKPDVYLATFEGYPNEILKGKYLKLKCFLL